MTTAATTSGMFTVFQTHSEDAAYGISLFLARLMMCAFSTHFSAKK